MPLTEQEALLLDQSAALWDAFLALPVEHRCDRVEFMSSLHDLQRHILARPVRRELASRP
jgi:hypothetical protein